MTSYRPMVRYWTQNGPRLRDQLLLLVAQMRSADCIEQGPLSEATRKTFARTEFFSV